MRPSPKLHAILPWLTLSAMLLGVAVGLLFGKDLAFLGNVSKYVINLIKYLAMPLLFCAIVDTFLRSELKGKGVVVLLGVAAFNALCAITIALLITGIFKPGASLPLPLPEGAHLLGLEAWMHGLGSSLQSSQEKSSLLTGTTLAILVALSLGFSLFLLGKFLPKTFGPWNQKIVLLTEKGLSFLFLLIDWIVVLIPIAVFCSVVKVVGEHGLTMFKGLAIYVVVCLLGMGLQIGIVYQSWIRWVGGISLSRFWKHAFEPAIYAFGVNSSLATLPITLKALKGLGVRESSARLSACIGTNFNNDGILLYEVVAALFIAQAYGIDLSLTAQVFVAVIAVVACIGVAGIPEAGIISLTIVLTTIGLPVQAIPILLTVDWILARSRSFTNVLGDITGAIAIDKLTHPASPPDPKAFQLTTSPRKCRPDQ